MFSLCKNLLTLIHQLSKACSILLILSSNTFSDVILDGSLGTSGSLPGPNFQINADYGKQEGTNLFHSFSRFNINFHEGETATFTNINALGPINNVLARVTGGSPSNINGLLSSTIPGAHLYFLNPAGVIFGPNASINVKGAFHVSTANYLELRDNGKFDTNLSSQTLLTTAEPESFGFLGQTQPKEISFQDSNLIFLNDEKFSVTAGKITTSANSNLISQQGTIELISVASAGEFNYKDNQFNLDSFSRLGKINLGVPSPEQSTPAIGNMLAKTIVIRGGQLKINNTLTAFNLDSNSENTSAVNLQAADKIEIEKGNIRVIGNGLNLNIEAKKLELTDGSIVSNETNHPQLKSRTTINVDELIIRGFADSPSSFQQTILSTKGNSDIFIKSNLLQTQDGAIATQGGNLTITANSVNLDAVSGRAFTGIRTTSPSVQGKNGIISLTADRLSIFNGARISSTFNVNTNESRGTNLKPGSIAINAKQIIVEGEKGIFQSSIQVETQAAEDLASGKSGTLVINSDKLAVRNKANISTRTLGPGEGGEIIIKANVIEVINQGTITSRSESSEADAGKAGTISINANDSLELSGKSEITVATEQADAGNIDINADLLHLKEQSSITTSVAGGEGSGGNININPTLLILNDASKIIANAQQGNAGNIDIQINDSGTLFESLDSVIEASSQLGIDGNVEINAPDVDITSGFKPLPSNFLDVATVLQKPCAQRFQGNAIQFVNQKYQVLPDSPYALRTASYSQSDETRLNQSISSSEESLLISKNQLHLADCL